MSQGPFQRRVVVVGAGGFIGRTIVDRLGLLAVSRSHTDPVRLDDAIHTLVLAGRAADIADRDLSAHDFPDFEWLRAAARGGKRIILLSSQTVYGRTGRLNEDLSPAPASTYGRNVLRREEVARAHAGEQVIALRIGNVIGFDLDTTRRTFMSQMLSSLRDQNRITMDVSPFDARDFIPVRRVADAVARIVEQPSPAIVNVGAGVATPIGALALATIRGFGRGDLLITGTEIKNPFVLDTGRLRSLGEPECTADEVLAAATAVGQRLAA